MHTTVIILICMIMCNTVMHAAEDPFSSEQELVEIQSLHRGTKGGAILKKTTHSAMAAQQVAERLPLLTQHMPETSIILRRAQENVNNAQISGVEILRRCDQLETLLRHQSHTATLLYDYAEFNYCPAVFMSYWNWIIRQVGIITEEEYMRRHIAVILVPENRGTLAQHPDPQVFWNASHALDRDTEKELEHFKHAIRTIQQKQ